MILAWESEMDVVAVDRDIAEFRRMLRYLADSAPVSAEASVRRAEFAQRCRVQVDWLMDQRKELMGRV